jgi:uncharacterized protein YfiM (DUF2279 family)
MKNAMIALALTISLPVHSNIMKKDKQLHYIASAGVSYAYYEYSGNITESILVCTAIGLGKEFLDEKRYGGFSHGDLIADTAGCLTGVY